MLERLLRNSLGSSSFTKSALAGHRVSIYTSSFTRGAAGASPTVAATLSGNNEHTTMVAAASIRHSMVVISNHEFFNLTCTVNIGSTVQILEKSQVQRR